MPPNLAEVERQLATFGISPDVLHSRLNLLEQRLAPAPEPVPPTPQQRAAQPLAPFVGAPNPPAPTVPSSATLSALRGSAPQVFPHPGTGYSFPGAHASSAPPLTLTTRPMTGPRVGVSNSVATAGSSASRLALRGPTPYSSATVSVAQMPISSIPSAVRLSISA